MQFSDVKPKLLKSLNGVEQNNVKSPVSNTNLIKEFII